MAWSAIPTKNAGDAGLSADWNAYVKANEEYLKGETDKIYTASQTDITASRAIDGTIYHNTSGKIRFITVAVHCSITSVSTLAISRIIALSDSNASPSVQVADAGFYFSYTANNLGADFTSTFIVPAGNYYKITAYASNGGVTPVLLSWIEDDLF